MERLKKTNYSVLDLAYVRDGETINETFKNTLDSARFVDDLGFSRYWLSEHHNMQNVASAATSLLIGYVTGGTSRIKVGSGGIMLPNHTALSIAEQFGTLDALYPNRIDLGLGRAPVTEQLTASVLRRGNNFSAHSTIPDDEYSESGIVNDNPRPRQSAQNHHSPTTGSNSPGIQDKKIPATLRGGDQNNSK